MTHHAGSTTSAWMAAVLPELPKLTTDLIADVCVIGAGIAGLSTAYQLTRAGYAVVVLEDGQLASGETERTTAHLSTALDDRYCELAYLHGPKIARLAAESHAAAIDVIEQTVREERIECDFARVDGYLFNAPDQPRNLLERELAAARGAGLTEVEMVERAPLISFDTGPALLFPHQGQIHPTHYIGGLADAILRRGGQIYGETHATAIRGGPDARVETVAGQTVHCGAIVVATNSPVNDHVVIHTKQSAYRTYVIAAAIPVGTVPSVLYWDTGDPYHYVRLQPCAAGAAKPARDLLIVGGEDHKTGQDDEPELRFARLESWMRERFPMAREVVYRWSGQVLEPIDGLAFIGRNPGDAENVFIVTGDSGHGMTHGTIAGVLLTDLIAGRANPWAEAYDPARITAAAAKDFLAENANIAAQYTDWLSPSTVPADIPLDCGAIIRRGLGKMAVYRDEHGQLHECSAVCPHLRAIVKWNDAEKTWDCPAHGSRFDRYGHVLNGPANADLPSHALRAR